MFIVKHFRLWVFTCSDAPVAAVKFRRPLRPQFGFCNLDLKSLCEGKEPQSLLWTRKAVTRRLRLQYLSKTLSYALLWCTPDAPACHSRGHCNTRAQCEVKPNLSQVDLSVGNVRLAVSQQDTIGLAKFPEQEIWATAVAAASLARQVCFQCFVGIASSCRIIYKFADGTSRWPAFLLDL